MTEQSELDFSNSVSTPGLDRWLEERRAAQRELAHQLGLPLGHQVEVWLTGGVRLVGELRLLEERLFPDQETRQSLRLVVDGVDFGADQVDSCVRQE